MADLFWAQYKVFTSLPGATNLPTTNVSINGKMFFDTPFERSTSSIFRSFHTQWHTYSGPMDRSKSASNEAMSTH